MSLIYRTKSVCPVCLRELYADVADGDDGVYMRKSCPEHGDFSTLIWADSRENYVKWLEYGGIDVSRLPRSDAATDEELAGCGFDRPACCQPASSALMVTNRCNMDCPVCFTRDKKEPLHEPSLEECGRLLRSYRQRCGEDAVIEFCGGEPTVREDLCELARLTRSLGFDYIQLNTNGIRLAAGADYCASLREAGVTTVYMGFDGVTDRPYFAKYGKSLLDVKKRAVENCKKAGLAVVLVTCVIPGENDGELGDIVSYAKENMPTVRGVYLQPISYFGIYPPDKIRRITIPDVIRRLAEQHGDLRVADFGPGACDHAQCSFNACYMLDKSGHLRPLTGFSKREPDENAVHRLRKNLRATWLPGRNPTLTIGGMAFQDAWSIDLLRLRRCTIQILQKDGALVPLCAKYLGGCDGSRMLPGLG